MELPEKIENVIECKNPRCITITEQYVPQEFKLVNREKKSTDAFIAMLSTREHFQLSDFSVNFPTLKQTVIFCLSMKSLAVLRYVLEVEYAVVEQAKNFSF